MIYSCTQNFFDEYHKLIKVKAYKWTLPEDLYEFLNHDDPDFFKSGSLLNGNHGFPFIKIRINGSGGYRIYYYIIFIDDQIILTFIHPKTGQYGADNADKNYLKTLMKEVIEDKKANKLLTITLDHENRSLNFIAS